MPSRDFTSEDLFSSRMMSMQSSTHSSQMNTVGPAMSLDRKSTRLNSSHDQISYAVFCLKKKKTEFRGSCMRGAGGGLWGCCWIGRGVEVRISLVCGGGSCFSCGVLCPVLSDGI